MAGGLYRRLKTWGLTEVPQATDLNKEFDNVKNNFMPQMMASFTQNVAQMKLQTSPGSFNNESLATALSDELQRYRYQFAALIGGPNDLWYEAPSLSMSQINTLLGTASPNRLISGRTRSSSIQPMHIIPNGSSVGITVKCSVTPFVVAINGTQYSFNADITANGFSQPPATNNTAALTNSSPGTGGNGTFDFNVYDASEQTKNYGDFLASFNFQSGNFLSTDDGPLADNKMLVSSMGSSISSLIGTYQAFSYVHSSGTKEYFIGFILDSTHIAKCFRGYFFDSSDNPIVPQAMTSTDTVTLMQLTWLYLSTTGTVAASYTSPRYSVSAPTSPAVGDYWYDLINQTWKTYNGASWAVSNSILIGVCIQDGTNTIAARSFDTYRSYSSDSSISVSNYSTTEWRSEIPINKVNLYGTTFRFDKDFIRWNTSNMDTGLTLTSGVTYFLYLSETGASVVSNIPPHRRWDLGGYYHPSNPWRCFGMVFGAAGTTFDQGRLIQFGTLGRPITDKSISVSKLKARRLQAGGGTTFNLVGSVDDIVFSNVTATFTTVSASPVNLTDGTNNISATLQTTGRPVDCFFGADSKSNSPTLGVSAADTVNLFIYRATNGGGAAQVAKFKWIKAAAETWPAHGLLFRDFPPAGSHVYTVLASVAGGSTFTLTTLAIGVMEI